MHWRLPRGGKLWEENKGEPNRRAFRKLVAEGDVFGSLAFDGDTPVGWCCIGPRSDFPRLERTKALLTQWSKQTWSVVCFYINSRYRRRGVARELLNESIRIARQNGAAEIEGYPAPDKWRKGGMIPAAFAYTGTESLFQSAGFVEATPPNNSRPIYVLRLI
jgi:GNAT superfamily N-acetyltransferase